MHHSVLVIGAGPSGSMAALHLARLGVTDIVIVDQADFPRPKPCAGGIAPATEKFLKRTGYDQFLSLQPSAEMSSVRFVSPDGTDNVTSSSLKAMAINRSIFDAAVLHEAVTSGVTFIPRFILRDMVTGESGEVIGATDGSVTITADAIVMATGGHNRTLREKWFPDKRPLRLMTSRIAWFDNFENPEGRLEMIFDPMLLPHYGWVFPEGNGRVNIGICLFEDRLEGKSVNQVFDEYLAKYYSGKIEKARQVGPAYNFPINTSVSVGAVVSGRMLLCGEAARLCDPATAEGISFALESGYLAAESIHRFLSSPERDIDKLRTYQRSCERAFNRRLFLSSLFRWFVTTWLFSFLVRVSSSPFVKRFIDKIMPN